MIDPEREAQRQPGDVPLGGYVRAIRAHPFVVVAVALAAVAGSGIFLRGAPTYEATARVLVTPVSPADPSFTSLPLPRGQGDPSRSVQTAAEILNSPRAAELTAQRVAAAPSAEFVRTAVTVEPDPESNTVTITAEATDADTAAELANEFAAAALEARTEQLRPLIARALSSTATQLAQLPDQSAETAEVLRRRIADLESIRGGADPTVSLAQEATSPTAPAGLARPFVLALALIAGTVIGIVASLLIELLVPQRVRREGDVLQRYPLPVLARVPLERDHAVGAEEGSGEVVEAYRSVRTQLEVRRDGAAASAGSRIVVITSSGRGDGRTTSAIGLAQAVTRRRQTAVLVELDLARPALAARLDVESEQDLGSYHADAGSVAGMCASARSDRLLSVITAPPASDLDAMDRIAGLAPDLLAEARSLADWVIVDAPPLSEPSGVVALGSVWDELVLVSRVGHTHEAALTASRALLESLDLEAAGHVIIGVSAGAPDGLGAAELRSTDDAMRSASR